METNEVEALSLEELQEFHQGEVNRVQGMLDKREPDDKCWDKLRREEEYHLDKVQYYAKLINDNAIHDADKEAEKSKRESERSDRMMDNASNHMHERRMKKWDVFGKIAAIAAGVGLTYGLEKLLNCMPNRNADKYIPRA